jgi:RimJ/RimL family protein N-acetyltransferase
MAMVPIHIATERLLIQPLVPTDIEAMHAVFSDPEVMRYVPVAHATANAAVPASSH